MGTIFIYFLNIGCSQSILVLTLKKQVDSQLNGRYISNFTKHVHSVVWITRYRGHSIKNPFFKSKRRQNYCFRKTQHILFDLYGYKIEQEITDKCICL